MKIKMEAEVERMLLENYPKYYKVAYSYVRNEDDALDIVQESAYKAIRECRKVKEKEYIDTWIYRIVINAALDFLRKEKKQAELADAAGSMEGACYEDGYATIDIMDTLSRLKDKDRTVIVMRYFEGFKLEQIAAATDEELSAVKSRLYRALKRLKIELQPESIL